MVIPMGITGIRMDIMVDGDGEEDGAGRKFLLVNKKRLLFDAKAFFVIIYYILFIKLKGRDDYVFGN